MRNNELNRIKDNERIRYTEWQIIKAMIEQVRMRGKDKRKRIKKSEWERTKAKYTN